MKKNKSIKLTQHQIDLIGQDILDYQNGKKFVDKVLGGYDKIKKEAKKFKPKEPIGDENMETLLYLFTGRSLRNIIPTTHHLCNIIIEKHNEK